VRTLRNVHNRSIFSGSRTVVPRNIWRRGKREEEEAGRRGSGGSSSSSRRRRRRRRKRS